MKNVRSKKSFAKERKKENNVIKEYIDLIVEDAIQEAGAVDSSPLYRAFIAPFTDTLTIIGGEVRKIGNVAASTIRQLSILAGAFFSRLMGQEVNWREQLDQARQELRGRLGEISSELQPIWAEIDRSMGNGDASAIAFLLNPGAFVGGRVLTHGLGNAIQFANDLTGNSSSALASLSQRYQRALSSPGNLLNPQPRPAYSQTAVVGDGGYAMDGGYGYDSGGFYEQVQRQPRMSPQQTREIQQIQSEFQQIMNSQEMKQLINSQPFIQSSQRTFLDGIYQKAQTGMFLGSRSYSEWKTKFPQQASALEQQLRSQLQQEQDSEDAGNNLENSQMTPQEMSQFLEDEFQRARQQEKQAAILQFDTMAQQTQNQQLLPIIQQYRTRIQNL